MPGFYATIARYYDAENTDKTDDIPLYLELAQAYGGPVMDIGCGTGRVMLPLAGAGYEAHGIDNEPRMLERGREIAKQAAFGDKMHFHEGDATTYDLDKKFKLMLVPYNGLMHFHEQKDQLALLKNLRKMTADDGLMVLDLPNAGEVFATQDTDSIIMERTFVEPVSGHIVMQQSVSYLDRTTQLLQVTWIYDEITDDGMVKRTFAPLLLYYYFYSEVKLLLQIAGFKVDAVYGDTDHGEFIEGCERMVIFAKPV